MCGGWSAHLEFADRGLRVRTDFVTRPPRLEIEDLAALWRASDGAAIPYLDLRRLAELKKTNRERDWAVIGELARRMTDPRDQMLYSRSARDLVDLGARFPELLATLLPQRPSLAQVAHGRAALEVTLDAERRTLMRANEARLLRYLDAARAWQAAWLEVDREVSGRPLMQAHALLVERASALLPFQPALAHG